MKHMLRSLIVLSALAGVTSVASDKPAGKEASKEAPTTQSAKPINKFCPVQPEDPIDPNGPTVVYKGKVIGFCCADCVPTFQEDPEKYMKNLR